MDSIAQTQISVKKPYQLNKTDRADIMALADHALTQVNHYKALWLTTGDPQAWRLWQVAREDRETLLEQAGGGP